MQGFKEMFMLYLFAENMKCNLNTAVGANTCLRF